jgi:gamma-glutamyltranspeptidase / glutathione hydrolase
MARHKPSPWRKSAAVIARICLIWLGVAQLTGCSTPSDGTLVPQGAAQATAHDWPHGAMVSAANPHAVQAAIEVLDRGGHAVDAAIAAHAVLGLVEPESSGLGGSAFMLVYDRASDTTVLYDGRETAPALATRDMFFIGGTELGFLERWPAGLSVGVPGTVALYKAAHERYGEVAWSSLFGAAVTLATDGFVLTEKFVLYNERLAPVVLSGDFPKAAAYLFPDGISVAAGDRIRNPEYARTLQRIANEGIEVFYRGDIARDIVARVAQPPLAGILSEADLANYSAVARRPVCAAFRENSVCSAPPPSSGVAVAMIPALYDLMLMPDDGTLADKIGVFIDAQRLAYSDRDHYVGDADFVNVPLGELVDPDYLKHRAGERFAPDATPTHGDPFSFAGASEGASQFSIDRSIEAAGTTHLSVIDRYGNAVSMTASVGAPLGSLRMTNGFFLNNQMSDFSVGPPSGGAPLSANDIAAHKRPRSSMSPTIVFDSHARPLLVTGSPGGNSIIAYTAKSILGILDWGLSAQEAADFPNIIARGESVLIEADASGGASLVEAMTARGYRVTPSSGENSGLHLIVVRPDGLEGAADSRRPGAVGRLPPTD